MPHPHNIMFIGPEESGKTQIITRLATDKAFSDIHKSTSGLRPKKKEYGEGDKLLKITYYDLGPDVLTAQINQTIEKSSKICLVFDASQSDWENRLEVYLSSNGIALPPASQLLLLGNKMDLIPEPQREAVTTDIIAFARRKFEALETECMLVSAKEGTSFPALTQRVLANLPADFALPARKASFSQRSGHAGGSVASSASVQQIAAQFATSNGPINIEILAIGDDVEDIDELGDEHGSDFESDDNSQANEKKSKKRSAPVFLPYLSRNGRPPIRQQGKSANYRSSFSNVRGSSHFRKDERKTTNIRRSVSTPPPKNSSQQGSRYTPTRSRSSTPPTDTTLSFALRMAGLALIITAITSLIYLAIVAAGLLSSVAVTAVVNQVAVTIGGLLGMTAPATALTQLFATYGFSTAVGSELLAASASVVTLGLGYGLRRLGQKPVAANDELDPPATRSTLSFALRLLGIALLLAAVVNLVYLLLIAINVLPAAGLMAGMSSLLGTVGGVLGFSAPMAAFTNACAAIGVSATAATGVLSATGSVLMAGMGYSLFKRNPLVRPPVDEPSSAHEHTNGRSTPPLEERQPRRR